MAGECWLSRAGVVMHKRRDVNEKEMGACVRARGDSACDCAVLCRCAPLLVLLRVARIASQRAVAMAQPGGAASALAAAASDAQTLLCRVDDACLLNIFRFLTPLPDLFAAAAVCRVRRYTAAARRLVGASARAQP